MNFDLPIALETKDLIGLVLLVGGSLAFTTLMVVWPRLRGAALFLMVAGAAFTGRFDLNMYSAYWYRGTTRGFEVTLIDVLAIGLLFSTLLLARSGETRRYWPASLWPMLIFLVYCTVTLFFASPVIFGLYEVSKLVRGIIFFLAAALFVRQERQLTTVVLALSLTVVLESLLGLRERYLMGVYRVGGSLDHPNSLSMYLCLVTPILIAAGCSTLPTWVRRVCWMTVPLAAVTILLTLSRAGLPIFVVVVAGALLWCGSWRPTLGKAVVSVLGVVLVAGLVVKTFPQLKARYGEATLQEEYFDAAGESRGYYFRQAKVVLDDRPFGVGLNNWSFWVSRQYGEPLGMYYEDYTAMGYAPPNELLNTYRYAAPAHNLGVLTVTEVGWAGLALLGVLWLRWIQMGMRLMLPRRHSIAHTLGTGILFGMGGVFLQSITEWTYRQTQIFLLFHLLAGVLASLYAMRHVAPPAIGNESESPDDEYASWEAEVESTDRRPVEI